jgi:hypothetical protein
MISVFLVLLSYVAGFTAGRGLRPYVRQEPPMTLRHRLRVNGDRLVIIALSLGFAGVGLLAFDARNSLSEYVACTARYDTQSSQAQIARTDANEAKDEAMSAFLSSLAPAIAGRATERQAARIQVTYRALQRTDRQLAAARAANPYPEPPSEVCGTP